MLILCILFLIMLVAGLFFRGNGGKFDKRTFMYIAGFSLASLAVCAGMWFFYEKVQFDTVKMYLIVIGVFLVLGLLHWNSMFKLLWARRDSYNAKRDSIAAETSFSVGLASLMVILALAPFGYVVGKLGFAMSMSGLLLAFLLPFIIAKSFDFYSQIPKREFDSKWVYETYPFDEAQWKRENMVSIGFIVADSIENENRWFHKKARFKIVIPRDQELRLIFRLALREYHRKNPSIPVQELGYEENLKPFWWLFKVKFILWKPNTWRHHPKYLDPTESLAFNNVKNGDFIKAKRIMLIPDEQHSTTTVLKSKKLAYNNL